MGACVLIGLVFRYKSEKAEESPKPKVNVFGTALKVSALYSLAAYTFAALGVIGVIAIGVVQYFESHTNHTDPPVTPDTATVETGDIGPILLQQISENPLLLDSIKTWLSPPGAASGQLTIDASRGRPDGIAGTPTASTGVSQAGSRANKHDPFAVPTETDDLKTWQLAVVIDSQPNSDLEIPERFPKHYAPAGASGDIGEKLKETVRAIADTTVRMELSAESSLAALAHIDEILRKHGRPKEALIAKLVYAAHSLSANPDSLWRVIDATLTEVVMKDLTVADIHWLNEFNRWAHYGVDADKLKGLRQGQSQWVNSPWLIDLVDELAAPSQVDTTE